MVRTHHHFHSISFIHFRTPPETSGGTLGTIFSSFFATLTTEARLLAGASPSASASLEFWGSAGTRTITTLQRSAAAREGHRAVMEALILFFAALCNSTSFGDPVEVCKVVGGKGTAKLTAKLGRATYGADVENLSPDPGAMRVLLTKGMMEGLAREVEV
jgi:dihydroxyacetone kinase